jgi:SPP1 gp7 family putative phage head morphogenesis protein
MKTTTDPLRFEEAVAWFKHRLSQAGYLPDVEGLVEDLSREARHVSAKAQLDLVTAVYEGIDAAIADGQTFNDFRARIVKVLEQQWGGLGSGPASRLDAIFRTNVQRAYMGGRLAQYREPDILATRPVWRFSAILDGRTSEICAECNGVVRPAADAWWHNHQPPLHHRCRSTVIAMSQRSADVVGLTDDAPDVEVPDGFGDVTRDFRPRLADYPRALAKAYKGPE